MIQLIAKNPLVHKIAAGDANQDMLDMLFERQLPFTEEEYLEALVFVMKLEPHKARAIEVLREISVQAKTQYIGKKEANHRVAYFVLLDMLKSKNQTGIARIIQNQALPEEFLRRIAQYGDTEMLETLLGNQIKLIAFPDILELMEKNPQATTFIKGKILEIRTDYLTNPVAEAIKVEDLPEEIVEAIAQEAADGDDSAEEAVSGADKIPERILTSLQKINQLSVPERIKLSLTGNKTERMILIKDSNVMVSQSVLESPKLTDDEVIIMIRDRSISREIIGKISNKREWTKNYPLVVELVQNPKTPMKRALTFLRQLHVKDLRHIMSDKNVHYVVRNVATNLYREKTSAK